MGFNLRSRKLLEPELTAAANPSPMEEDKVMMDSGSDPRSRALRNEYILAELLSHLSVDDLKECRLVNRVWSQVATRVLAPKAPTIKLLGKIECLKKLMNTMTTSENFPWKKFAVDADILVDAKPKEKVLLFNFFERVAPSVVHLKIYSDGSKLFPRRKPKKETEFSKLKSLELEQYPTMTSLDKSQDPSKMSLIKSNVDFMISILQHSGHLESVSLIFGSYNGFASDENFELHRLIDNVPWNKLTHLKLDGELENGHFQTILELGAAMKLKSFEVMGWNLYPDAVPFLSESAFQVLLDRQSSSLETLTLRFAWLVLEEHHTSLPLPKFPKLKKLKIELPAWATHSPLVLPSFTQHFPVLNSVEVGELYWVNFVQVLRSEDSLPVETVKTLKLNLRFFANSSGDDSNENVLRIIRHAAQMFPRVTNLGVPARFAVINAVGLEGNWKDLKQLTLIGGKIDDDVDSALIGYSRSECNRIATLELGSQEYLLEERKIEDNIPQVLHNLKSLELDSKNTASHFSDLSCRLLLLKLKNLRCLDIRRCPDRISKEVIDEMISKFEVMYKNKKPTTAD